MLDRFEDAGAAVDRAAQRVRIPAELVALGRGVLEAEHGRRRAQRLADLDRHCRAGRHVVLICHDCTSTVPNPAGEDWLRPDGTVAPWAPGATTATRDDIDVLSDDIDTIFDDLDVLALTIGELETVISDDVDTLDIRLDALQAAIEAKTVTYDLARQIRDAQQVKCSEFGEAIIKHMD